MGRVVKCISALFVIIGALNWGLVGLFEFDLVAWLFGEMSVLSRTIYVIVGFCAVMSGMNLYFYSQKHNKF